VADEGPERLRVQVVRRAAPPHVGRGLGRWLAAAAPARAVGEVTVALIGDGEMRTLNRRFRNANYVTDVLSFPADREDVELSVRSSRGAGSDAAKRDGRRPRRISPPYLGDIVIAIGVARRQARDARHALSTELRVLALHGLLHLLGYDHEGDRGQMASLERRLRARAGLREGLIEREHAE
jgi:probable rRNA maturation factor